jgi:hypothetical protein
MVFYRLAGAPPRAVGFSRWLSGTHFHNFAFTSWFGNGQSFFHQTLNVNVDRLTNEAQSFIAGFASRNASRKIWDVCTPTVFATFKDDRIPHLCPHRLS